MTTRNFDALFEPKSIALIGASNRPGSVGAVLARNLFSAGFDGPILTVNPHEEAVHSTLNYHSVADLPLDPELAVIATPPETVPGLVAELGARGCRAAVVVTAGFGEGDRAHGQELREQMLEAAKPHLLRIVGPNCLGFISPGKGINASFAHLTPKAGDLAFVSQSGAIATAMLDWADARGVGFSHVISLGDMADVDFGDLLDHLALDPATRAILLYVESITEAAKFMSAGRIAARTKPVLVIKSGRSSAGAAAAMSHTGALAGSDLVYDAAFRRAGMLRVFELRELFEAVTTLSAGKQASGDRLTILTNGGGAGVLATDALDEAGGRLATLSPDTIKVLDAALPHTWSRANPVDLIGDAPGARYQAALEAVLAEKDSDAVLVMNCPTAVADSLDAAKAVVDMAPRSNRTPVLTCWLGETAVRESRQLFAAHRIPTYDTPNDAIRAFMQLVDYRRNQDLLIQVPRATDPEREPDRDTVREILARVAREGRKVLTEPEAKTVLLAYGIPTVATRVARTPEEAGKAAAEIGKSVVLKILSVDITHKSDVGGVRLDLDSPQVVEEAARDMLARIKVRVPDARIDGFSVQEMASRPAAHELLLGMNRDPTFGPVLLFGQGGTAAEVIGDRAIGLPPLNPVLAADMVARTRISKLLKGYRDRPPANLEAIEATLVKLSELIVDFLDIAELDINPLLADDQGVLALDARIVIQAAAEHAAALPSIAPYPAELVHDQTLPGGEQVNVRPVRPVDAPRLHDMVSRCTPEDIRLRFFGAMKSVPPALAARLSQIDYGREMALVAVEPPSATGEILGIGRIIADPENDKAEFALLVRSDWKSHGIGFMLLGELVAYARERGLNTLFGDVLTENGTMLTLASEFGFARAESAIPSVVRVTLDLNKQKAA